MLKARERDGTRYGGTRGTEGDEKNEAEKVKQRSDSVKKGGKEERRRERTEGDRERRDRGRKEEEETERRGHKKEAEEWKKREVMERKER